MTMMGEVEDRRDRAGSRDGSTNLNPANSPTCQSVSGCIGPDKRQRLKAPDWLRYSLVSSFGYFYGIGPYYAEGSLDLDYMCCIG